MRHKRKLHHIALALTQQGLTDMTGFSQFDLVHNCVTEVSLDKVDLTSEIFGKKIRSPFIINAITGGPKRATNINIKLSMLSRDFNIPMAVGSQTIAIKEEGYLSGFKAVRRINPRGILISNVSAHVDLETAQRAVDMLRADALQLHLNPAQELMMKEGDKSFEGLLENIQYIKENIGIPVMVKEVGSGISHEAGLKLKQIGIDLMDTGGYGGTNFIQIEGERKKYTPIDPAIYHWGIPTATSIQELSKIDGIRIIAGGGINYPLQAVKAIALGADYVSMAGFFLKHVTTLGQQELVQTFGQFLTEVKTFMALQGVRSIPEQQSARVRQRGRF